MASQGFVPPYAMQFRPAAPAPQLQQFVSPPSTQQFHVGPEQNIGIPPGQSHLPLYSQLTQPFMQHNGQLGIAAPSPYQLNMPITSSMPQSLTSVPSHGVSFSSSYTFVPPSFGLQQNSINSSTQIQPSSLITAPGGPIGGQPWLPSSQSASVAPSATQQPSASDSSTPALNGSNTSQQIASDWQEYEAGDGRRYYYNKVTKQSSWEKPAELMTPLEKADALTVWKEFTTPEGRKYYYNKETKQSKWTIPDELKLAREQSEGSASQGAHLELNTSSLKQPSADSNSSNSVMSTVPEITLSPPNSALAGTDTTISVVSQPSGVPATLTTPTSTAVLSLMGEVTASIPSEVPGNSGVPSMPSNANSTPLMDNPSSNVSSSPFGGVSVQDIEEAKKGMTVAGKINATHVEEKTEDDEPFMYANKQEAKNAFKALLESANVAADWSWDQAMRVIINDKKYGALKSLGERKQAFNEYLMQRKKVEAEERRHKQRKAKEEFIKMLEESEELASSTRWSKAVIMFEDDKRFKAVDQEADREDLFRSYLVDLHKKEKTKAQEECRRNRLEFRQFLESCGFIKVDSQWRKVQDLLEDDEKCTRLDKIDRLEIFQDYIRDLEKEEDEQKKKQKEQLKRTERKNRDAFRKMMEEHVAAGTFTAKTLWRDFCQKVKDSEEYEAAASNTSGSTPRDLFEDVAEELEKKYDDDKTRIKDALKLERITVSSIWTFKEFKSSIKDSPGPLLVSDINLQLVYEDLIDRAKEKEEKESKKRKRLAKDLTDKLSTFKDINASSNWEECKQLFEDSSEYRSIGDESFCKEIFGEYVSQLLEKMREKDRKREEEKAKKEKEREEKEKEKEKEKRRDKDRREKDRERIKDDKDKDREREKDKGKDHYRKDETESETLDVYDSHGYKDDKKSQKDKDRRHRKRHQSIADDVSSDKEDREETKKSRKHGSDRKKSRKHAYSTESDSESRHKRHKRDHRDGSRRSTGHEELEDGELGEDGEIQ